MLIVYTRFLGVIPFDVMVERNHWLAQLEADGLLVRLDRTIPGSEVLTFDHLSRHDLGNLLMSDPVMPDSLVKYDVREVELSGPLVRSAGNPATAQKRRNPAG